MSAAASPLLPRHLRPRPPLTHLSLSRPALSRNTACAANCNGHGPRRHHPFARRHVLTGLASTTTALAALLLDVHAPALATYYSEPIVPPDNENVNVHVDELGFAVDFPAKWVELRDMELAREVGVMCSYLNPRDQSETLAVYRQQLDTKQNFTAASPTERYLGGVDAFAKRLVDAAPGQTLALARKRVQSDGLVMYDVAWTANGSTAGAFGSIYELRAITVDGDGVQWTTRGTASRTRWITRRAKDVETCVRSFHFTS